MYKNNENLVPVRERERERELHFSEIKSIILEKVIELKKYITNLINIYMLIKIARLNL